jgi:two-component sensor histidine kinase/PAS domain-containing protein
MGSGLRQICRSHSKLSSEDIAVLESVEQHVQLIADLTRSDIFIDCLTRDSSSAVVVAHGKPTTGDSQYRSSVLGQLAFRDKEPGVLRTLEYGIPTHSTRGVSQEGVCVSQSAIPIKNASGVTVGCLIMEQNVTEHIQQRARVELLENRTHILTESLLQVALQNGGLPDILLDGLVAVDASGTITYVNASASHLFSELYDVPVPEGRNIEIILGRGFAEQDGLGRAVQLEREVQMQNKTLLVQVVPLFDREHLVGAFLVMRDVTDIKRKEKELLAKTLTIRQVHHKVKNDLHTLGALLRMRQRNCSSEEGRRAYLEAISLINTIATFHEISMGATTTQLTNIEEVVNRIIRNIQDQYRFGGRADISVSGVEMKISPEKVTPVALILHEIVQNCFKHAADTSMLRVLIKLEKSDSHYRIRISDNGSGFGGRVLTGEVQGTGLQIVNVLVREVFSGSIRLLNDGGAVAELEFPMSSFA